jgi:GTP 3',8-cyclase
MEKNRLELYNFDFSKKIFYHPEKIVEYKDGLRPFPTTLEVDLTNACNHKCSFCFYADNLNRRVVNGENLPPAKLDINLLKERITEAAKLGVKGVSFSGGGEPLAHSGFSEILEHTRRQNIDCGLITNGSLMSRRIESLANNLQWVRVSMAGGDRASYSSVQGLDHFDLVLENVALLRKESKELNIGIRVLVTQNNLSSVLALSKLLVELNVNYLQLAPDQYTEDNGEFWGSQNTREVFSNVEEVLNSSNIKLLTTTFLKTQEKLHYPRTCYAHFFQTVLTAEGDLIFCKNARGVGKYILGNINQNTLTEIWNSEKVLNIEKGIKPSNCGLFCRCMALNIAMEDIANPPQDMSPNFVT